MEKTTYKAFEHGLTTTHGYTYELGFNHHQDGELVWQKNGFHTCEYPEDTLRYIDAYNNDYNLAEMQVSGNYLLRWDDYNEFYGLYVTEYAKVVRIIPREEVFNMILEGGERRVERFIVLSRLTDEEIEIILNRYPKLQNKIDIYQNDAMALKMKY